MSYEERIKILLNQGLIKKQKIDYPHIEALLFTDIGGQILNCLF